MVKIKSRKKPIGKRKSRTKTVTIGDQTPAKPAAAPLFRLHLDPKEDGLATRFLTWCMNKKTLAKVKETNCPYVLIVVSRDNSEVPGRRQLVPLDRMGTFISFDRPGACKIWAAIVSLFDETDKQRALRRLKSIFFTGDRCYYHLDLIRYDGNFRLEVCQERLSTAAVASIEVDVAAENFAAKPPNWLWRWVNLFREYLPIDECHFRRRFLFAFTLQPFLVLMLMLASLIIRSLTFLFWFASGMRFLDLRAVWQIWHSPLRDIYATDDWINFREKYFPKLCGYYRLERSVFSSRGDGQPQPAFIRCLFPGFLLPMIISAGGLAYLSGDGLMSPLFWQLIGVGALTLVIICFLPTQKLLAVWREWWEISETEFEAERERAFQNLYGPLVCENENGSHPVGFQALPKDRRSLALRFERLKSRVCRPFAKS